MLEISDLTLNFITRSRIFTEYAVEVVFQVFVCFITLIYNKWRGMVLINNKIREETNFITYFSDKG